MGHGKETPRQKMIGMMYLVLTALLALNVSAEVLNAFGLVDESLRKSYHNMHEKNNSVYTEFENAMQDPGTRTKAEKWKPWVDQVKEETQNLFDRIDSLKERIVWVAEKDSSEESYLGHEEDLERVHYLKAKSDNNVPGQIMILEKSGAELKNMIDKYDSLLVDVIEKTAQKRDENGRPDSLTYGPILTSISNSLKTDSIKGHAGTVSWESGTFEHLPLAAVLTMLSKVQTDIRNSEGEILNYLRSQIQASPFKFNKIEAIVKANSSYIVQGNAYEAEVFIAASDTTVKPEIFVGGRELKINKEGKGLYTATGSDIGLKKWGGVIKLKNQITGKFDDYKFDAEYQVAKPSLVISPTKMNVFYIGVDNPVDISVSGIPMDKVKPSISAGQLVANGNSFIVKVKTPGKVNIGVKADFGGTLKDMGAMEFRVKRVPDPIAKVANKTGGVIKQNVLLAQTGVVADLENFDFDLKFRVSKFTISTTIKGYSEEKTTSGFKISSAQRDLLKKVRPGNKVYFENIEAQGPDGSTRKLPSIAFKIN